jgi:hypothetical protein
LAVGVTGVDWRDEPIAALRQRFDEAGAFRRVTQGVAEMVDCLVQTAIEIDKRVSRPELFLEFVARYYFARVRQQEQEDGKAGPGV